MQGATPPAGMAQREMSRTESEGQKSAASFLACDKALAAPKRDSAATSREQRLTGCKREAYRSRKGPESKLEEGCAQPGMQFPALSMQGTALSHAHVSLSLDGKIPAGVAANP